MAKQDLYDMSDEDIANMSSPPEDEPELPLDEPEQKQEPVTEEKEQEEQVVEDNTEEEGKSEEGNDNDNNVKSGDDTNSAFDAPDDESVDPKTKSKEVFDDSKNEKNNIKEDKKDAVKDESEKGKKDKVEPKADDEGVKSETKEATVDYEATYKEIMAPFKANGKEISVRSPEEARQLMQMGANYTKKLQSLQPNLKMMKMLEVNGLLDENKISFMIDITKKNPDAIKKLLKDSNIDPMDIDTSEDSKYVPQNHSISDKQMQFDNMLEDILAEPVGGKVVLDIDKNWDNESKKVLYDDPSILKVMAVQKATGIYDQIANEVDRQKTLGNLNGVSYITAYHQVGQALQQQGLLRTPQSQGSSTQTQSNKIEQPAARQESQNPEVLDRRPAPRKPADPNSERARATTPVRSTNKPSNQDFNPLSMSDEEFMKSASMGNRY